MKPVKKVIIVYIGAFLKCPPACSLARALSDMGLLVTVVTSSDADESEYEMSFRGRVGFEFLPIEYENKTDPVAKLLMMPRLRKEAWRKIDMLYDEDSLIWVVSDVSLKQLGMKVCEYRYVLHLLELSEELLYYKKIDFIKLDAHKLGSAAQAIVVAEENRAAITQVWWRLSERPLVLHNKPYGIIQQQSSEAVGVTDLYRERIADRKLILYQGIVSQERPLDPFLDAVSRLGPDYIFGVMSSKNPYPDYNARSYLYIPYLKPPLHLQVTKLSRLGVLSYFPVYDNKYSPLNSIYCAPNKVFEFSKYGIPMIGNDIPGLREVFQTGCGRTLSVFSSDAICRAIVECESSYSDMAIAARRFYESVDTVGEIAEVLSRCEQ